MIGIYKITNQVNGKVYIGQSINIKQRWKNHKKDAFWEKGEDYHYPLYKAMRKYGLANFSFEVLEECNREQLNEKEIFYISQYNAYGKGYNQNAGGNSAPHSIKLDVDIVKQIITLLKTTNHSNTELAKKFQISEGMIRAINSGECWPQPNEKYPLRVLRQRDSVGKIIKKSPKTHTCAQCGTPIWPTSILCKKCANDNKAQNRKIKRPQRLELAKMVSESSFVAVGKEFGVSGNTIAKWCKEYGMPHNKEQLKRWYCEAVGSEYIPPHSQRITKPVKRPVQQIDIASGQIINTFESIAEANKSLHTQGRGHISDVCTGKRKTAHGYKWKYK